jgi:hypothetical protein
MICPDCCNAELVLKEHDSIETHGLECGPYEHFHDERWECPDCGACFTAGELEAIS